MGIETSSILTIIPYIIELLSIRPIKSIESISQFHKNKYILCLLQWTQHEYNEMNMNQPYQKVSAFTRRIQCTQIFSYSLILSVFLVYLSVVQYHLSSVQARITLTVLIVFLFCLIILVGAKVSSIDPVDTILLEYRNGDPRTIEKQIDSCLYCQTCNSYVKNTSKHCRLCQRCVDRFDHHCIWLNSCIGEQNYRLFVLLIILCFSYFLIYLVSVGLLHSQQQWSQFIVGMVFSWIAFGVSVPFCLLLLALIIFHIFLMKKGVTTFQFIMANRASEKIAQEQKQGQKQKQNFGQISKTQENLMQQKQKQLKSAAQQILRGNPIFEANYSSEQSNITKKRELRKANQKSTNSPNKTTKKGQSVSLAHDNYSKNKSLKYLFGQSINADNPHPKRYETENRKKNSTEMVRQKNYRSQYYNGNSQMKVVYKK